MTKRANKFVYAILTRCSIRASSTATAVTAAVYPRWTIRDSTLQTCEQNWWRWKSRIVILVCNDGRNLPVEYSRDADGHEIGKYPRMRAIATRPVNRRYVIPDRLFAVVVLVQSGDEDLYIREATWLRPHIVYHNLTIARTIKIIRIAKVWYRFST